MNLQTIRLSVITTVALTSLACLCGLFTDYDFDRPDTPANQEGFKRHVGFPAPDSVSDLYYFADELGADVTYQLGFNADQETMLAIVSALDLVQEEPAFDCAAFARAFDWWEEDAVAGLTPYWKSNPDGDYYRCLWFDPESRRAYYIEFSL
jgi:hypothetical protein